MIMMKKRGIIFLLCGALALGPLASAGNAEEMLAEDRSQDMLIEEEPGAPETSVPETSAPETSLPETSAPETSPPETSAPETSAPETSAPETSAPETSAPETSAPETGVPEASTSETGAPSPVQPETGTIPPPTGVPGTNSSGAGLPGPNRPGNGSMGADQPLIEEEVSAPDLEEDVTITREKMKQGIRSGEKFQVEIKIRNNRRDAKMTKVRLKLEPEEGISLDAEQKTDSIQVENLGPGEEKRVKVRLSADQLPEKKSTIKMKTAVSYQCQDKNGSRKERAEATLLLPVDQEDGKKFEDTAVGGGAGGYDGGGYGGGGYDGGAAEQKTIDPMTPNLIVSQYSYGKEVMAGEEFVLEMEVQNTNSKTTVENIVMSADTGDAFVIADSSNTFYFEQLKPRETVKKALKLKAMPEGQTANGAVTLSFKYEYLKKEERAQGSSEVKIAVPIIHPDRFSVGEIKTEGEAWVNEEASISLPYVNKGKSTVYNMEARLETGMDSDENYKFLGNVEAGSSGTIDFFVTPREAGKQELKLIVTYEDAAGNEKTAERQVTLQAEENVPEEVEDYYTDQVPNEEGAGGGFAMGMIQKGAAAGGAVLLLALLIFFKRRRYKKSIQFHGEV